MGIQFRKISKELIDEYHKARGKIDVGVHNLGYNVKHEAMKLGLAKKPYNQPEIKNRDVQDFGDDSGNDVRVAPSSPNFKLGPIGKRGEARQPYKDPGIFLRQQKPKRKVYFN